MINRQEDSAPGVQHCLITSRACLAPENAYGAGKTTAVRILATRAKPDGGRATVIGRLTGQSRSEAEGRAKNLLAEFRLTDAADEAVKT